MEAYKILFIAALFIIAGCSQNMAADEAANLDIATMEVDAMELKSSAFGHNARIPVKYTCDGKNISPPLSISSVPEDAKALVLIMDDPDVPKSIRPDGMWDHWVVFNIPVSVREIPEGKNPDGVLGRNTGGKNEYTGPCPPDREHRYFFKLYALDAALNLQKGASKADVEKAMKGHAIAQATLIGLYKRG
jgi:Raf kinase inhibitor-like YbhB/YbcL family protein